MSDWTVGVLFCGAGGATLGFERAGFRTEFAIDHDDEACADHEMLCDGPTMQADLGEMQPRELADLADERPDVIFTSPPCKSFSGCLPAAKAETDEYRELSSLAQRGIFLALEAWPDEPPPLIVMENVPRIQTRGEEWLEETVGMLRAYGYAVSETTHDCGRIGGLAQHRNRYLLVARHTDQVPEFLYEPPKERVRGIGEALGELPVPVPGGEGGGPMHHLPRLSALNWVRLALIPAGGDWRDLPEEVGVCDGYRGRYGVLGGTDPSPTIRGAHSARLAPASWADPRVSARSGRHNGGYGVNVWPEAAHTVTAEGSVQNTWASVSDPRVASEPRNTAYGVGSWSAAALTVLGSACHDNGEFSVADPRVDCERREGSLGVQDWPGASPAVIANASIHNWPMATADPRLDYAPIADSYGVTGWEAAARTVRGVSKYTNCNSSVADPRCAEPTHFVLEENGRPIIYGTELDLDSRRSADPVPVIVAGDGCWHRPLSTLELAALQGFPTKHDGDWLELAGGSHKRWRERIGNAVPPPAAEAVARTCAETLEAADGGEFILRGEPVWVDRPEVNR